MILPLQNSGSSSDASLQSVRPLHIMYSKMQWGPSEHLVIKAAIVYFVFFLFLFVPLHVDFSNGRIYFGYICEISEKLHLAKITLYTVFLNLWMEEQEKCVINYVSFLTLKRRDFRIIPRSGTTIYFTIFSFVLA